MRLFFDCDGVMANFDKRAGEILGMHPRDYEEKWGSTSFWDTLESKDPEFYLNLEPIDGALEFFERYRKHDPIVLTGAPLTMADSWWQKPLWVQKHLGQGTKVAVCQSKNKYLFCKSGDTLVDDFTRYQNSWIAVGGNFVLHTSFEDSIAKLTELGYV